MRSFTQSVFGLLALSLLVAVGCQRLNVEKDIHVSPGEVQDVIIDAPRSEQKIKVDVTSTAPIDVYVILSSDQQVVKDKLLGNRSPDPSKLLANQQKAENASLDATIPAKNEFRILLAGAKKPADVKVKVTSR